MIVKGIIMLRNLDQIVNVRKGDVQCKTILPVLILLYLIYPIAKVIYMILVRNQCGFSWKEWSIEMLNIGAVLSFVPYVYYGKIVRLDIQMWITNAVAAIVLLVTRFNDSFECFRHEKDQFWLKMGHVFFVVIQMVMAGIIYQTKIDENKIVPCPYDNVGILNRCLFSWVSALLDIGYHRRLEERDVPQVAQSDKIEIHDDHFQNCLLNSLQSSRKSFLRLLLRLYGKQIAIFAIWSAMNKAIGLTGPILLKYFLDWADDESADAEKGWWIAGIMCARAIFAAVSSAQYGFQWKKFDIRVRAGFMTAIYRAVLKLNASTKSEFGVGRITNLVTVDLNRLLSIPGSIFDLILIPIEVGIAFYLLYHQVSYAFTIGLVVLAVMLPIQTLLGSKIQSITKSMLQFRDDRVQVCTEGLSNIKIVRMMGCFHAFKNRLAGHRSNEMRKLKARKYLDAFCVFFWASTPVFVQSSVFVAVIYSGSDLSAANAFVAVALLNKLIYPMNYFPWIISGILEARISAIRIRDLLYIETSGRQLTQNRIKEQYVSFQEATFTWQALSKNDRSIQDESQETLLSGEQTKSFCLEIDHLNIAKGSLIIVLGQVGSGKSSFLLSILGELRQTNGKFFSSFDGASYAPQIPWLLQGTIRDNILLGSPYDSQRYSDVVESCALQADFLSFEHGDQRKLHGNGATLSGGQRSRIALARAMYQYSDLYLFDDPTNALDVKTSAHIFENCFGSKSNNATTILATNAIQHLPLCQRDAYVVVLKEGRILERGNYLNFIKDDASYIGRMIKTHGAISLSLNKDESNISSKTSIPLAKFQDASAEHRESGIISRTVWISYGVSIGGCLCLSIIVFVLLMQASRNALDGWLAIYTTPNHHGILPAQFAEGLILLTIINCVLGIFRSFLFAFGGLRAAYRIYDTLVDRLLHATMKFIDETSMGRILNRISGDTYAIDESLPFTLNIFLKQFFEALGGIILVPYGSPYICILFVPLGIAYYYFQQYYRPSSRHLKRLDSVYQSPLLELFTDSVGGLHIIRAAKLQNSFMMSYKSCLEASQRMSFFSSAAGSWFSVRLELLSVLITCFVTIYAAYEVLHPKLRLLLGTDSQYNTGILGLTLTYALPMVYQLNSLLNTFIDTEKLMVSLERINEFSLIPGENNESNVEEVASTWPVRGVVVLSNLSVKYDNTVALRTVSMTIQGGESVGICGRTGSGKSTLLGCFFRLYPFTGKIIIDGMDISRIEISKLRKSLSCIPQSPVLFSGSIRFNLDPFDSFTDSELWSALRKCQMAKIVKLFDKSLETIIGGSTELLSVGQIQLLCIGRALLRESKVICIDEATSSIDWETDLKLQQVLTSEFKGCTVIMIAHRMETMKSMDKIAFIHHGTLVEYNTPTILLANPNSAFSNFVKFQS